MTIIIGIFGDFRTWHSYEPVGLIFADRQSCYRSPDGKTITHTYPRDKIIARGHDFLMAYEGVCDEPYYEASRMILSDAASGISKFFRKMPIRRHARNQSLTSKKQGTSNPFLYIAAIRALETVSVFGVDGTGDAEFLKAFDRYFLTGGSGAAAANRHLNCYGDFRSLESAIEAGFLAAWVAIIKDPGCGYGIDGRMMTRRGVITLNLSYLEEKHGVDYDRYTLKPQGAMQNAAAAKSEPF